MGVGKVRLGSAWIAPVLLLVSLAPLSLIFPRPAAALDNPHTLNNSVNCDTCHISQAAMNDYPNWFTSQGDQTGGVCGQCHNPGNPALYTVPHASPKYDSPAVQCTICHYPHTQRQSRYYKSQSYISSGSLNAIDAGQTTLTIDGALNGPPSGAPDWTGYYIIPSVGYPNYIYKIASNTGAAVTISMGLNGQERINTTYIKPGSIFAIVYGKLLREYIQSRYVRFFRSTGPNSFADGDAVIDGACQVCHDRTSSFDDAGALEGPGHPPSRAGTDCMVCHPHAEGFKASCNTCHGNPPTSNTSGGPNGLANNEGGTGSTTPGAHLKHAVSLAYPCDTCHSGGMPAGAVYDKNIQIGFNLLGGAYQGGTYDGRGSLTNGYSYSAGNAGTAITQSGAMNCSNIYCHSNGTSVATGRIPANTSPSWGSPGPLACTGCHGYPPSYPQMTSTTASPKANEHAYHMSIIPTVHKCDGCHYTTTTTGDTITNPANHVNGKYDVVVAPGMFYDGTPVNFTYRPDPGGIGGYCDNVTCHGGVPNTAFWGRISPYVSGSTSSFGPGCYDVTLTINDSNMINIAFPITYTWNFGDGQTESGTSNGFPISAFHHYADGAKRTVTISGRDGLKRYFSGLSYVYPQAVGNRPPVAGWQPMTHNRYTVTVTDISYDPDYGTCETGPGQIAIVWGDNYGNSSDTVYLTKTPLNKNYTYTYIHSASDKTYTVAHSVTDNGGASAINSPQSTSVTVPGQTAISGRITLSDGTTSVAGVTVYLKSNYFWITCAQTTTDANGSYSFSGTGGCYNDTALYVSPCGPDTPPPYFTGCNFSPTYTDPPVSINRTDVNFTALPW